MDTFAAAEQHKERGNEALKSKNFAVAVQEYSKAIDLDPSNLTYLSNRSAAFLNLGQSQQALHDADEILKANPQFSRGFQRRGMALLAMGNNVDAVQSLEKAVQLEPQNAQYHQALAQAKQALSQAQASQPQPSDGQRAEAQKQFKMLEDLFAGDPWANLKTIPELNHLEKDAAFKKKLEVLHKDPSKIQEYIGDQQVLTYVQTVLQFQAVNNMSPEQRAKMMAREAEERSRQEKAEELARDRQRKAEKEAKEAAEKRKKDEADAALTDNQREALALKDKANALFNAKKFEEALAGYQEAIQADPTNMVFYNNKAACYWEMGQYDKVIEQSLEALDVGMEHRADFAHKARAYQRIGSSHMKKEDYDNAIAQFKKSMIEKSDKKVLGLLRDCEKLKEEKKQKEYFSVELAEKAKEEGNNFAKKQQFPDAVKCYTEAIKRDPSNHIYYSNRSAAYLSLLAYPEALKDANKCLELKPDFVKGYIRKGKAQFAMKEFKAAWETYMKGFELDNNNSELITCLQQTRVKLEGKQDEDVVKRNIERDPELQSLLQDPLMNTILGEMQRDPRAATKYFNDPTIGPKLNKLIEAGIISTK